MKAEGNQPAANGMSRSSAEDATTESTRPMDIKAFSLARVARAAKVQG